MDESKIKPFNPLVSIIIPVYNGANYMREAIDSALAQSYKNVEILVINDGSKDNGATQEIALVYGDKIRYIYKENGGVATALNVGIKEMKGEYFSWLSHDDKYLPQKIQAQVDFLQTQEHKEIVIYTDGLYIDDKSEITSEFKVPLFPVAHFRPIFCMGGIMSGCSLLIPRKCFDVCGDFNPKLRTTQDYDMFFRISEKFTFVHIPHAYTLSRKHEEQDSIRLWNTTMMQEANQLYCHFLKKLRPYEIKKLYPHNFSQYYILFAQKMRQRGSMDAYYYALKLGFKYLIIYPPSDFKKTFVKLLDMYVPSLTRAYIKIKNLTKK